MSTEQSIDIEKRLDADERFCGQQAIITSRHADLIAALELRVKALEDVKADVSGRYLEDPSAFIARAADPGFQSRATQAAEELRAELRSAPLFAAASKKAYTAALELADKTEKIDLITVIGIALDAFISALPSSVIPAKATDEMLKAGSASLGHAVGLVNGRRFLEAALAAAPNNDPTDAMLRAGQSAIIDLTSASVVTLETVEKVYRVMEAAR